MLKKSLLTLAITFVYSTSVFAQSKKPTTFSNDDFSSSSSSSKSSPASSSITSTDSAQPSDNDDAPLLTHEQRLEIGKKLLTKVGQWKLVGKFTSAAFVANDHPMILEMRKGVSEDAYNIAIKATGDADLGPSEISSVVYLFNKENLEKFLEKIDNLTESAGSEEDIHSIKINVSAVHKGFNNAPIIGYFLNFSLTNYAGDNPQNLKLMKKSAIARIEFQNNSIKGYLKLNQIAELKKFLSAGLK